MTTLTEFLLREIAADEARYADVAGDAKHQDWAFNKSANYDDGYMVSEALLSLAVCKVHRAIVEWCDPDEYPLRALASIYKDRDGFDEAWAKD